MTIAQTATAVETVLLKLLKDAEADHDPVYGVILGAYTNHSAEADSNVEASCSMEI